MTENPVPGASPKPTQQNQDPARSRRGSRPGGGCDVSAHPHDSGAAGGGPRCPCARQPPAALRLNHAGQAGAPAPSSPASTSRDTASPASPRTGSSSTARPPTARLWRPPADGSVLRPALPSPTPCQRPQAQGGLRRPDPGGQHGGGGPDRRRRGRRDQCPAGGPALRRLDEQHQPGRTGDRQQQGRRQRHHRGRR